MKVRVKKLFKTLFSKSVLFKTLFKKVYYSRHFSISTTNIVGSAVLGFK
jgi:hypothetical protein